MVSLSFFSCSNFSVTSWNFLVLQELVRQMTDSDIYSDCLTVTAGHFLSHLMRPLQETIPETAHSLMCVQKLAQADVKR